MTKVLFSVPIKREELEKFQREFPNIEFIVQDKKEDLEDLLLDVDIWVDYGMKIKGDHIKIAHKLKWLMVYAAGLDQLPKEEIIDRNILITNVRGIHKHSIAEQVFSYILYREKKLDQCLIQQKNKIWNRKVKPGSIYGKTLGIIGLGAIGKEIARKGKAFDMKVIGIRNTPKPTDFTDEVYGIEDLELVLSQSDYVVMVLPFTEKTKHIMNEKSFRAMKKTGYFINIARGEVVKTKALIEAIRKNIIAGAALDVFEEEPLPKDHALWDLENLIITPHTSGLFPDYNSRSNDVFNHNLGVYNKKSGDMINMVNLSRGY